MDVDADGIVGRAVPKEDALTFLRGEDGRAELALPPGGSEFLEVDVTSAGQTWVIAARVRMGRPLSTTRVVLYEVVQGASPPLVLLRDEAGPPSLVTTVVGRTHRVTVAFVAQDALNARRVYGYAFTPGIGDGVQVPQRLSQHADWAQARLGLSTHNGETVIFGAAEGINGAVLRYQETGNDIGFGLTVERPLPGIAVELGVSVARRAEGAVYALHHEQGLIHGAFSFGEFLGFGPVHNLAGEFSMPRVSPTPLGYLAYVAAVFGGDDKSRASALLLNPNGTLLGGPLELDPRRAIQATGRGAMAVWSVKSGDVVVADTGCN